MKEWREGSQTTNIFNDTGQTIRIKIWNAVIMKNVRKI